MRGGGVEGEDGGGGGGEMASGGGDRRSWRRRRGGGWSDALAVAGWRRCGEVHRHRNRRTPLVFVERGGLRGGRPLGVVTVR